MIAKKMFLFHILLGVVLLFFNHCTDPIPSPQEIPIETLLAAPDTLMIFNRNITLSVFLWRDFQPISPPDGKPLIALVYIETADSSNMPDSINAEAIYLVNNGQIWNSFLNDDFVNPENNPFRIIKIARDGPKWDTNIYVEAVVSLIIGNDKLLLRADNQYIGRTD